MGCALWHDLSEVFAALFPRSLADLWEVIKLRRMDHSLCIPDGERL
jgi:hypothetical protein